MSGGGRKGGGGVRQRVVVPSPLPLCYNAFSPPSCLARSLLPLSAPPISLHPSPGRSGCVRAGGVPYHSHRTGSRGLEVCAVGGKEGGARPASRVGGTMCGWVWEPFFRKCCPYVWQNRDRSELTGGGVLGVSPRVRSSREGGRNGGKWRSVFASGRRAEVMADKPTAVWGTALCFGCSKKKKKAQEFTRCFNRTLQNFFFFCLFTLIVAAKTCNRPWKLHNSAWQF